jgi:death-on-curing protein
MAAYYEGADLIRQATLLAIGISQNQAFVDGNKRTAVATADAFLRLNGYKPRGNGIEFAKQLEAVAGRSDSLDAATDRFELWLRENTIATGP